MDLALMKCNLTSLYHKKAKCYGCKISKQCNTSTTNEDGYKYIREKRNSKKSTVAKECSPSFELGRERYTMYFPYVIPICAKKHGKN